METRLSKTSVEELMARLPLPATPKWRAGVWDATGLAHGTMTLSVFAPRGTDYQTPHEQDELYLIVSGTATFTHEGEMTTVKPGDGLFVPAGDAHRFTDMSEDFVTWVVFWGPKGGEVAST